jgi:hypothetical protein
MWLWQLLSCRQSDASGRKSRSPLGEEDRVFWSVGALLVTGLLSLAGAALAQAPDAVLINGRIVTLDARSTVAEAVAVKNDRIAAVGASTDIGRLADAATRIIDLGGRTVIPGLIDSHIHAIRAGLRFGAEVSWIGSPTIADAMGRIRDAAKAARPGAWIVVAGGWTPIQFAERRRPTQGELVAAAPDNPVYVQLFYNAALLTPMGFAKLGIATDASLPPGGKIERGADGNPTGWIEGRFPVITALYARLPQPTLDQSIDGTRRFLRALNRFGLTGVIDPGGYNLAPDQYEALFRLWRERALTVRVVYSICAPTPGSELKDLQTLTRFLPMGTGDDWLRFNGIGERVTWGMNNNSNPTDAQKDAWRRIGLWAAKRGLTLTMHWNEDRSVHHLLDLFERINREVPLRPLRWSIAHLYDASDASLRRMAAIGVGWLMQNRTYFANARYLLERRDTARRIPPIGTALRLGLPVGGGTDAHRVMDYNPFVALRWMLDGLTVERLETRDARERPSREQALRIYTQGSAWFAHDETRRGALAPGRLADLAVLSADYMTVPVARIGAIRSLLTMVGGRIVYADGPFAPLEESAKR